MAIYECNVCGYLYDEVITGLTWSELDGSWVCPICDSGKAYFTEKASDQGTKLPTGQPARRRHLRPGRL